MSLKMYQMITLNLVIDSKNKAQEILAVTLYKHVVDLKHSTGHTVLTMILF